MCTISGMVEGIMLMPSILNKANTMGGTGVLESKVQNGGCL